MEAARIWGGQRRLWRRDGRTEELATTMEALAEEDEPKVSMATTEASAEEAEETTCLIECLLWWRQWCFYGLRLLMTRTEASSE